MDKTAERQSEAEAPPPGNVRKDLGDLPVNYRGNLLFPTTSLELRNILLRAKTTKRPVVIKYGSTWCHACKHMLPTFCNTSNENPKHLFIYADVDECEEETEDVRYTPTFRFLKDGEKVDEFYGVGPQRLRDRLWLHS